MPTVSCKELLLHWYVDPAGRDSQAEHAAHCGRNMWHYTTYCKTCLLFDKAALGHHLTEEE